MANYKKKFAKLYDKYVDKIYRFVFLKVSSQEIAEDLTGQVFAKGWGRISKTKNQKQIENVPAYLYQIARAEIANYYRDKAKFQTIQATTDQIADPGVGLEEKSKLDSDFETVRACLPQLKEDYQDVLIWRYLDDYSNKEIGRMLRKSEGAVRVMIHRALKELREKMEQ